MLAGEHKVWLQAGPLTSRFSTGELVVRMSLLFVNRYWIQRRRPMLARVSGRKMSVAPSRRDSASSAFEPEPS